MNEGWMKDEWGWMKDEWGLNETTSDQFKLESQLKLKIEKQSRNRSKRVFGKKMFQMKLL
jgi:hypothetical protein